MEENGYKKELYEEFGNADNPLDGLSIYLTKILNKASQTTAFLIDSYQEDAFQCCPFTEEECKKREDALFFCIDCISKNIQYKFDSAREAYDHFCKFEDEKMDLLRLKCQQDRAKKKNEES